VPRVQQEERFVRPVVTAARRGPGGGVAYRGDSLVSLGAGLDKWCGDEL